MKLSLILIALFALIASSVLALPTPEREDIIRVIKFKRDSNDYVNKISQRKEKPPSPYELTPKQLREWEKNVGVGKRDAIKKLKK
ncbi:hypothetical protein GLOIN_2v1707540 [Rhizophagus clarus]|uniref:Uncharacterized protein n=1 Tax=Rhizophagus clarus TaxID=94130 RepID=A0A8H3LCX5_9GLOM|nr:hypothetical protein GLOIN_2v1707540 [Rhizophagus clarus]